MVDVDPLPPEGMLTNHPRAREKRAGPTTFQRHGA